MSHIRVQNPSLRAALVSNFFVAELLSSRRGDDYLLWLVSPWVTNFGMSLPPGGDLSTLVDSAEAQPSLFEVLRQVAANGGQVAIVVRPEYDPGRRKKFITPLLELAATESRISVRHLGNLHAKIYAGHHGALYGSLNLTESGVEHNIEFGTYVSDTRTVSQLRSEARDIFSSGQGFSP